MTASDTCISERLLQSAHLIRGFSQMLGRHSLAHAGAYPDLPLVALSQRTGWTSVRPRNRRRNSATFSAVERVDDSGGGGADGVAGAGSCRQSIP